MKFRGSPALRHLLHNNENYPADDDRDNGDGVDEDGDVDATVEL